MSVRRPLVIVLLASVALVGVGARSDLIALERAAPCPAPVAASPCHPASTAPPPAERCDPFRSSCALECRLLASHFTPPEPREVGGQESRWPVDAQAPFARALGTADPVPRPTTA
jgi:hypothetical protein